MKNSHKNMAVTLLVMMLWGSLFPIVKIGMQAFCIKSIGDILFFAGVRFTIGGLAISLYSLIRNKADVMAAKKYILKIFAAGMFAVILHYAFTYTGLTMIDSSKTAILKKSGALFYILFAGLFIPTEKLTLKKLIGALLGFGGIVLMNWGAFGIELNLGTLLIIAASFCTVFSNIISKRIIQNVSPIVQTGISQLFGGIVLTAAGIMLGGKMQIAFCLRELSFVYICIASVLSYCIWFEIVKNNNLSRLFIVQFAEPVFAAIFGAILLKESIFEINYIASFAMIFLGIYIANKKGEVKNESHNN